MIVILGLIILVAAVIVGVAGVLGNGGSAHALTHGFSVFGYHVTGSTGTLFLYGIVVGAVALAGLSLLLAGARRTSRRGSAARRGLQTVPPGDRRRQPGPRRPDRPARHRPRLHRRARSATATVTPAPAGRRPPAGQAAPVRAPAHCPGRPPTNAARPPPRPAAETPAAETPASASAPAERPAKDSPS